MVDAPTSSSFGERLTTKIGPLPAWAWAIPVVGIAYGVYYYRKAHGNAAASVTTEAYGTTDGADHTADQSAYGVNDSTGTVSVGAGGSTGGTTTVPDNSTPASNPAWESLATSFLVGQGYPASEVAQGLNNWILGLQASAQDTAMFNLAVARFGLPPDGVPPQPTQTSVPNPGLPGGTTQPPTPKPVPKPKPKPKPVPTKDTEYRVVSGDNLTRIAAKFDISEPELYSRNAGVIEAAAKRYGHDSSNHGNLIFPGTVLVIG